MKSSNKYQIAETHTFKKRIAKEHLQSIYTKIYDFVYPQLRDNPFFGPNIKKLKGEFSDIYRYRVGDRCLFYQIDNKQIIVFILDLKQRKDSY